MKTQSLLSVFSILFLFLTGCGQSEETNKNLLSDDNLITKVEGYDSKWYCIGKSLENSNENLVVTLLSSKEESNKYFLLVDKKIVNSDASGFSISTKGLFWSDSVEVEDDDKATILSFGSKPIGIYSKESNLLILELPRLLPAPTTIDCSTKKILN